MTNMDLEPYKVIQYYCGRGNMENFIKEGKNGFAFTKVSSAKKIVNANLFQIRILAYTLFNYFRRMVLPKGMKKQQIDTIATFPIRKSLWKPFQISMNYPFHEDNY